MLCCYVRIPTNWCAYTHFLVHPPIISSLYHDLGAVNKLQGTGTQMQTYVQLEARRDSGVGRVGRQGAKCYRTTFSPVHNSNLYRYQPITIALAASCSLYTIYHLLWRTTKSLKPPPRYVAKVSTLRTPSPIARYCTVRITGALLYSFPIQFASGTASDAYLPVPVPEELVTASCLG